MRKFLEYVSESDAKSNACSIVLVTASLSGALLEGISVDSFRQLGVSTDLVPNEGMEEESFLASDDIADWGELENIHNRKALSLESESEWIASSLIEF